MRDSLTVLAILVIGVLTAALVGPHLVDWEGHRALVERRLSEAAGTPVTVAGRIDLELLPKPVFSFGDVAVGDGAGGRPRLDARSLDAELSLTALMRGQVQVVDATLVGPKLRLAQAPDGGFGLVLPPGDAAGRIAFDRVAFDHLGVRDGALDIALADGRRLALAGIDFDGEAASLRGPFKMAGKVEGSAGAVPFRFAAGALEAASSGERLRVKLHIGAGEGGARPSVEFDGAVAGRPGALGPGFDGTAAASGRVALAGTPATVPWRATAKLSVDRDGAKAGDVELRAGADLRALIAAGDGTAAYAAGPAPPRAALKLRGAALDADALAVAPTGSLVAPPQGLALSRLLLDGAGGGGWLGGIPLRLDVDAAFDTATLAGRTALGTAATARLGPEPGAALSFSVDGPGGARLSLDGRVEPAPAPAVAGPFGAAPASPGGSFRGRAELRVADPRRTAAWLRPAAPDLADAVAARAPGGSLRAAGAVDVSATGFAARDLDVRLDGTALTGTLSYDPAAGSGRSKLVADLAADALDLDRLPGWAEAAPRSGAPSGPDLDLSLSARAIRFSAPFKNAPPWNAPGGPVTGGRATMRVTRAGDDLRLERLSLELAGARLDASGSRDAAGGRAELHADAAAVGPLVDALAPLLPGQAAAVLRARAALLSPLDATVRVEAAAAPDGALVPTRAALAGRVGWGTVEATLSPDGPSPPSPAGLSAADRPVALTLRAEAPRGVDLVRLIGPAVPGSVASSVANAVAGVGRLSIEGRGTLASGFAGRLDAALGDASASYAGRAGPAGGAGRLALRASDLRPALTALGLWGRSTRGAANAADGTMGDAPLAGEGAGDLAWDGVAARWSGLSARVGGTAATGELSLDLAQRRGRDGEPLPIVHGRLALDRLPAAALLGLALGPAAASAEPWSMAPFAPPPGLPRGEIALAVGDMPLRGAFHARGVSLTLRTAPDGVALADLAGDVPAPNPSPSATSDATPDAAGSGTGGRASGSLTLRRDGPAATLSGRLAWQNVAVDGGGLSARTSGSEDVAASGDSPAALVASLGGTGAVALAGALPRTDPGAAVRVLAAVAARDALAERGSTAPEPTTPDPGALRRDLAAALDAGPLPVEAADAPVVLAGGVLRLGPLRRSGTVALPRPGQGGTREAPWSSEAVLALDLRTLVLSSRVDLGAGIAGGGRGGATVTRAGPLGAEAPRAVDPAGLAAAVQAAAVARAQDRIDVVEQDIRERAAFERQRKAAEQRRQMERDQERERVEAARQAEAARVAAEAQARVAAARAAAQAAADAQKAAAEARAAAAEAQRQAAEAARAEAVRQHAEDARMQAQVEAAARAEALRDRSARDEAEKQRAIDRALRAADPPLDPGTRISPADGSRRPAGRASRANGRDVFDPPPPPSIIQERGAAP